MVSKVGAVLGVYISLIVLFCLGAILLFCLYRKRKSNPPQESWGKHKPRVEVPAQQQPSSHAQQRSSPSYAPSPSLAYTQQEEIRHSEPNTAVQAHLKKDSKLKAKAPSPGFNPAGYWTPEGQFIAETNSVPHSATHATKGPPLPPIQLPPLRIHKEG